MMKGTLATTIQCLSRKPHPFKPGDHDCKHIVRKQYQTQADVGLQVAYQLRCTATCLGNKDNLLSANFCCQQSASFTCQDAELSIQNCTGNCKAARV
ncbi:hypothetical protein DPMN_045992 [Dreissena polymorpha]|uniref:Uncharacterized protein n=1 Tax=Dreissena polymorpha TaxID=45954 RepID=A0A9D4D729_DREPO|nr:hypothetical protein DPMN_045992 [Dreissena polymorpha]